MRRRAVKANVAATPTSDRGRPGEPSTWRGPLAGRSEQGLVPTPEQTGIMVLRLSQTPALDLHSTLTIECQPGRIG